MYLHPYIWTSTHKYRKQRQKRQNPHITWEKRYIQKHTQMLAFLFLASNAKHILQCISDALNTTLNTSWRCFEMCTPDKTKLNHLPPRRLTRKCVQKSRQSHFYFFAVENMESPYSAQHLKLLDSCNLVATDHTFPESPFPHCPTLS